MTELGFCFIIVMLGFSVVLGVFYTTRDLRVKYLSCIVNYSFDELFGLQET